jgi:alanine-synthesizing transaminase
VRYDIRGALNARAIELEQQGHRIVKLNIGNPGLFGFEVPTAVRESLISQVSRGEAYCHQQGLLSSREAIVAQQDARGVTNAHVSQVFIGNGVSELIDIALRALLEPGDEVLIPAPDYPLWTAAVHLNGGTPVYYPCLPQNHGIPSVAAIAAAITKRTRAIVVINPNNPTGAVYPRAVLEGIARLAEQHGLVVYADEIYDGLTFEDAEFVPMAPLVHDTLCVTMSGLSKVWRACGYRVGWMSLSGALKPARDYHRALDLLSALRLCGNVPGQLAIPAALAQFDAAVELTAPGGRLHETRRAVIEAVARSNWLSLPQPMGALYAFPGVNQTDFDDQAFALELLERKHILVVPGSSFNVPYRNHFRITLLPEAPLMRQVLREIEDLLAQRAGALTQAAVA